MWPACEALESIYVYVYIYNVSSSHRQRETTHENRHREKLSANNFFFFLTAAGVKISSLKKEGMALMLGESIKEKCVRKHVAQPKEIKRK